MKHFSLFSTKKTESAVKAIEQLLNVVESAVQVFRDGVKNYLYSDEESFKANLESMAGIESEALSLLPQLPPPFQGRHHAPS